MHGTRTRPRTSTTQTRSLESHPEAATVPLSRSFRGRSRSIALAAGLSALLLASCSPTQSPSPTQGPTATTTSDSPSTTTSPSATTEPSTASVTPTQTLSTAPAAPVTKSELKVALGKVFMLGVPATGASSADLQILSDHKVANVFLRGRSKACVSATKKVTDKIRGTLSKTTDPKKVIVATDQEGGYVQVLQGTGFSTIPTALKQGKLSNKDLQASARKWGGQLYKAGVNLNLAPVGDTVKSAATARSNDPIGYFSRQFGYDPTLISAKTGAFSAGMNSAGVDVTIKHFPGLGYVTANTDTTAHVKDSTTTTTSKSLRPFADAVTRGERWVMVSSAIYTKIDSKHIAAFSPKILKNLLRDDLGFAGIILSDDLCAAKSVSAYSMTERTTKFFKAGGTMFLCVDAAQGAKAMNALYKAALNDQSLARLIVDAATIVDKTKLPTPAGS